MAFNDVNPKQSLPEMEHEIQAFWEKEKIFEKSLEQNKQGKKYVFYDGPPFANGMPHYGHIMANALKDAVTRYWSMQGYYVPRRNGWDCHGLPVEYEIEKDQGIFHSCQGAVRSHGIGPHRVEGPFLRAGQGGR